MPVARSANLRLQIAHVGRLCRGSKPFSAKDQKDWQAAWFGQHMPNRCHPRKAAACELGLWLSSPGHSKPGGTLGWQCLWLSTLFITLLNLPTVAAQLNPPAFLKNLRALAVQIGRSFTGVTGKLDTFAAWFFYCSIHVSTHVTGRVLSQEQRQATLAPLKKILHVGGYGRCSNRIPNHNQN